VSPFVSIGGRPHNRSGSGTGPEQALEAIKSSPRAQRESSSSPELTCVRRTDPAEPSPRHQPRATASESLPQVIGCSVPFCVNRRATPQPKRQRDRAGASIGSDQILPSRAARKLILPELTCVRRTDPAELSPRHQPRAPASESLPQVIGCSVPFCVNSRGRPLLSSSHR
jgi:hypothetical protein